MANKSYVAYGKSRIGLASFILIGISLCITSCQKSIDPKLRAFMAGSVLLQYTTNETGVDAERSFYRISMDVPGHLVIARSYAFPVTEVTGPILDISPDRKQFVFTNTSAEKTCLCILNVDSGHIDKLSNPDIDWGSISSALQGNRARSIEFSPDSKRLAYSDLRQVMIYDCITKSSVTVHASKSEVYNSNDRVYAFAGDIVWISSNALYFEYLSSMPWTYEKDSENDPTSHADTYSIVNGKGDLIREGNDEFSLSVFDNTVFLNYLQKGQYTSIFTDSDHFLKNHLVQNENWRKVMNETPMENVIPLPNGKDIVYIQNNRGKYVWYLENVESGQKKQLGADLDLRLVENSNATFWAPDGSYLFIYMNARDSNHLSRWDPAFFAIPMSEKHQMEIDLKNTIAASNTMIYADYFN
jgi:hypothetical protein